jgi:hypothetical protein
MLGEVEGEAAGRVETSDGQADQGPRQADDEEAVSTLSEGETSSAITSAAAHTAPSPAVVPRRRSFLPDSSSDSDDKPLEVYRAASSSYAYDAPYYSTAPLAKVGSREMKRIVKPVKHFEEISEDALPKKRRRLAVLASDEVTGGIHELFEPVRCLSFFFLRTTR